MIQKKSLKDAIQNPEIISVVGELVPEVTISKKGLMSPGKYKSSGRSSLGVGYYKLAESPNWYSHYAAILFAISPASTEGNIIVIDWRGTSYNKNRLVGNNQNIKLYSGTNSNGTHELWIGLLGEDGSVRELVTNTNCFTEELKRTDILPDYLSEI